MASERSEHAQVEEVAVETQDRGVFDHPNGEKEDVRSPAEKAYAADLNRVTLGEELEKAEGEEKHERVEELEKAVVEEKHDRVMEELLHDPITSVKENLNHVEEVPEEVAVPPPVVETERSHEAEPKKGIMEKIKEKLPGQKKTETEEVVVVAPPPVETEELPKKGIVEKIKEKLPGHHSKTVEQDNN